MIGDKNEKIIFGKYKPEVKLGEGSFGKIYSAINIQTGEKFALKFEDRKNSHNLLEGEACILRYLQGPGIPIVKSYGFKDDENVLVMQLLGKSLEDLFNICNKKFSLKTVCMLAEQMITRLEYIHIKHIIHRDIKPDNFVMGIDDKASMVYLIDFGLSKKYRSSKTYQHISFITNKKLTGTARYASINALNGCEQSRRDDMEAIGYVLLYFLRGSLPWQGLKIDNKDDRYQKIYEKKKVTSAEELCKGFPDEFVEYINYTRSLEFEQEPNYEYTRGLFRAIMTKFNYQYDNQYDWVKPSKKEDSSKSTVYNKNLKNSANQNNFANNNFINGIANPNNSGNNIITTNINNNININLNTISNYNNINTIQNTNSMGKLNLNNDANNINIFLNNVSTTKNSNQNFISKSNSKIPKAVTLDSQQKFTGYNYNYNYPINNISAQRNSINNLASSKLNYIDIAPKTNKNESFPSLVINNSLKSPQNKYSNEFNYNQRNYSIKTTKSIEKTEKENSKKNKKETKTKFH